MGDLEPITRNEKLWSGEDLTPVTRREMYIKHLYDETQVIPEYPVTREEMFILKAGEELHDVTIEQLTATENKTYSEEGVAYSPVIVNVPLPENAYLLKEIEDVEIASFNDGSDLPMPKLEVAIEPQQDLHGYDAPWVGGSGKNKLALIVSDIKSANTTGTWNNNTYTINGAEYKINTDDAGNITSIVAKNVASNPNGDLIIVTTLSSGSYILSSGFTETNGTNDSFLQKNGVTIARGNNSSPGPNFTLTETSEVVLHLRISKQGDSTYTAYPMIRLATVSDATFAPYFNICPISGWDECNVTRTGKNLCNWKVSETSNALRISLKPNNYVLSAESTLPEGNWYIRFTDSNGEYSYSASDVGLNDAWTKAQSGWFYGWFRAQEVSFIVPSGCTLVEIGKLSQNGTINAQLEIGSTATTYEPYNGSTYTIQLGDTYYGGKLDVVSGVLTVDRKLVTLTPSMDWQYSSGTGRFFVVINDSIANSADVQFGGLSNMFKSSTGVNDFAITYINPISKGFALRYAALNGDITAWKQFLTDNTVQVCYELATPTTIQLTPTVVKSLRGKNNVWADTGNILDLSYLAKEE